MPLDIPFINGIQYSWASISLSLLSGKPFGVTKISYADDQEIENNYGAGNMPVGRSFGKITPTASVTMYMEEVERLQEIAADGRIQSIPEFDITVSFVPGAGKAPVRHVIKNCRFKKNSREVATGDMKIEVELEIIPSHIQWK